MADFEVIEHTADIGIRAFGRDLDALFENAAKGLFHLVTQSRVEEKGEARITLEGREAGQLLVDWLGELLFLMETEKTLFSSFEVKVSEEGLEATVRGEALDPERHELDMEIKAVTYHMLEVDVEKGYAQVIFDI